MAAHESSHTHEKSSSDGVKMTDSPSMDIIVKANNLISSVRRRREKERKAIQESHEKKAQELYYQMKAISQARENRINECRNKEWKRLGRLVKERRRLENLMIASLKSIETHTRNISIELAALYEGYLEEMGKSD